MFLRYLTVAELQQLVAKYMQESPPLQLPKDLERFLQRDGRTGVRKLYERYWKIYQKWEQEKARLLKMYAYEKQLYSQGKRLIAGLDEAGRGPLAGPVVAAAVILPPYAVIPGLKDSKQIQSAGRYGLEKKIKDVAVAWSIGSVCAQEIDKIGICEATRRAMVIAIDHLSPAPEHLIIDALYIPQAAQPQTPVVKGDAASASVAAASIVAKTFRDRWMIALEEKYPGYGFAAHKGYGTREHLRALGERGSCEVHRVTFKWKKN